MTEVIREPSNVILKDATRLIVWTLLDDDDSGQPIFLPNYSDKTVQIIGTFDSNTLTMYGSNDVTRVRADIAAGTLFGSATATWTILVDPQGNNIAKTSAAIEQILENPAYITCVNTGGLGSTATEVMLTATRNV